MKELGLYLKELYTSNAQQLEKEIQDLLKKAPKIEKGFINPTWYKHANVYVIYPDGMFHRSKQAFKSLIPHLDHIKGLGCQAVHILPFLDSPMVDKGFDISDFYSIRKDLGTLDDLKELKEKADSLGLHVFMDLVFNHISEEHEWFKKAESGDEFYREFFIYTKEKPIFIRKFHKDAAVWAEYIVEGKKKIVNIAFPEYTGEIPHWRQGKDGYWYYHTYYPQQLDINWFNPEVFKEFAKILIYWSGLGFNFRLDAIPFIGKDAYKDIDREHEATFAITAALNSIATEINPECAFLVETYESLNTVLEYFGTSNMRQAELSYNFHLCTSLWVSIVKRDTEFVWDKINQICDIPKHAEWINFLRNHDELSLAYLTDDLKNDVSNELLKNGAPFREGYGISGRSFSFVGKSIKRFMMSYFLLASLPGGMAIPYGDEIGVVNIPVSKLSQKEKKDTRNINRGTLTKRQINTQKAKHIYESFSKILQQREILRDYLNIWPERMRIDEVDKNIFAAKYMVGTSELIVLINLSEKAKKIPRKFSDYERVAHVNNVKITDKAMYLGPFAGAWLQK
jgi:maltose alpha-D-glucosyltransferase / alpha-amylase